MHRRANWKSIQNQVAKSEARWIILKDDTDERVQRARKLYFRSKDDKHGDTGAKTAKRTLKLIRKYDRNLFVKLYKDVL